MASYKVELKKSVEKDLRKIDSKFIPKIISAIQNLAEEPRPAASRPLVGSQRTYRVRVGDYRIVYLIDDDAALIEVQRVRHRKDVYK